MRTSIKLLLCGTGLLFASEVSNAQTSAITIEASQNITNFTFEDSEGTKDKDYLPSISGGYALGFRRTLKQGVIFSGKLGMRKGGATYVIDASNYSWNLHYFEARLGMGYSHSFGKLGAHLLAQPYFGNLLKASQRLNNEEFDIINSGSLNKTDYGVFISPGANFTVSDDIAIYLDLNYMIGIANLETDDSQISHNRLMGATLGVAFAISKNSSPSME